MQRLEVSGAVNVMHRSEVDFPKIVSRRVALAEDAS